MKELEPCDVSELSLYTDDVDVIVTTSPEDAVKVYEVFLGDKRDAELDPFERMDDEKLLTVRHDPDDEPDSFPFQADIVREAGNVKVTAKVKDWVAHEAKRTWVCSTEW